MEAELRPGPHLEDLLEGADAAGQGNKAVSEFGHQRLARVHRGCDVQFGQPLMREFLLHQRLRDDTYRLATQAQHFVGDCAHDADVRAAIDQPDAARHHGLRQRARRVGVIVDPSAA